ncbi:hypothetical protein GBA52_006507 [Prunus armeniaca]|nr:hypothetical protein GBA52_006507 [Prunus armeniaca]
MSADTATTTITTTADISTSFHDIGIDFAIFILLAEKFEVLLHFSFYIWCRIL